MKKIRVFALKKLKTDEELLLAKSYLNNNTDMKEENTGFGQARLIPAWFHLLAVALWVSEPVFSFVKWR